MTFFLLYGLGVISAYLIVCIAIWSARCSKHGSSYNPGNYDYRLLTNYKKIKIQLKLPSFWNPFGWVYKDYKVADSFMSARLNLYKVKLFDSEEQALAYIQKYKDYMHKKRVENEFEVL